MKIELIQDAIYLNELDKFKEEHKHCVGNILHKSIFSTTGGQYTYLITPAGLGDYISIKCNACGKVKDITNCDNW